MEHLKYWLETIYTDCNILWIPSAPFSQNYFRTQ